MSITKKTITEGWKAKLELDFIRLDRRTIIHRRQHYGPLQVQRPFYPESDGTCHVYILHPPGGVVGGDELTLEATLNSNARVLLTTPAAGKFYRSAGATAYQKQLLKISDGTCLEWFPQETIVYNGARLDTITRIELGVEAHFTGWEVLCLGRPAAAETFVSGSCRQRFEIWRDHMPLFLDHGRYTGSSELLTSHWGLQNKAVSAILVSTACQPGLIDKIRTEVLTTTGTDEMMSISLLNNGSSDLLLCRYLGSSADHAKSHFIRIWSLLRLAEHAKPGCPPRVWNT
jgi:urease accessory protein